jgi:acyl CoA:acetate/3-ketoacid CoA transferase
MSCKVSVLNIQGEEYLLYQAPKLDYALIRATTADENGNLSMEDEGTRGTVLAIAQAAKARPKQGIVIAQVRWLTKSWTLNPRNVDIPGPLVDFITVAPRQYHWQTGTIEYDPRISYRIVPPITSKLIHDVITTPPKLYEKVIARRVLLEITKILESKGSPVLVNLGIGIPAFLSSIVAEEDIAEFIVTVLESGVWGGVALPGSDFGLALSPFAISSIPDMFSNFEGGIIDAASLGFLQIDKEGNVNPSMLPGRIFGPGGFPVIAGGAPRTYFAGAFTAGLETKINILQNKLQIIQDGSIPKFVNSVFKIIFSGRQAIKYNHDILYITERAVFRLKQDGIVLEEAAPGIDIDKDVLSKMSFEPKVQRTSIKEMDKILFKEGPMGIKEQLVSSIRK